METKNLLLSLAIYTFALIEYAGYLLHGPPFKWDELIIHSLSLILVSEFFGQWKSNDKDQAGGDESINENICGFVFMPPKSGAE
jgi:hypothetical protein